MKIKSKRLDRYHSIFWGILLLLLFVTAGFFYNKMYFGDYKYPHKNVYTFYDYFMEMREDSIISEANFKMYMYSAFNTMLENREVSIDVRIGENDVNRRYLLPLKFSQDNIGVLNRLFDDEELNCQKYYLLDEERQEHKIFLFTGEQWENSSHIKIF